MTVALSVYIPAYNAALYLERVLMALLSQRPRPDDVLVVDDGSSDGTLEISRRLGVRVICHDTNRGLAAARNTGVRMARHDLVASIDADCIPQEGWVASLLACMERPTVGMGGGMLVESCVVSVADKWRATHMLQHWGNSPVENPPFMFGHSSIIRRLAFDQAGAYDEYFRTNGEDADFSIRLRRCGWVTWYNPAAVAHHLRSDTVRSILETIWRYRVYGGQVFRHGVTWGSLYRSRSAHRRDTFRFILRDARAARLELLSVSTLMLAAMPILDLRYALRQRRHGRQAISN